MENMFRRYERIFQRTGAPDPGSEAKQMRMRDRRVGFEVPLAIGNTRFC